MMPHDPVPGDPGRRTPRKSRRPADYAGIVRIEPPPLGLIGPPSARLLMALAARRWNVDPALLASASRDTLVMVARHHAMWLIRTHTAMSLPQIGKLLGGRDHTTVIAGIRRHEQRMAGAFPLPFVWTSVRAWDVLRYSYGGSTLEGIAKRFQLTDTALQRHPRYAEMRARSLSLAARRRAEAAREASHA